MTHLQSVRRTDRPGHRSSRYPHSGAHGAPHQGRDIVGAPRVGAAITLRPPLWRARQPGAAAGGVGRRADDAELSKRARRDPHHAIPLAPGRLRPHPGRAPRRHVGGNLAAIRPSISGRPEPLPPKASHACRCRVSSAYRIITGTSYRPYSRYCR